MVWQVAGRPSGSLLPRGSEEMAPTLCFFPPTSGKRAGHRACHGWPFDLLWTSTISRLVKLQSQLRLHRISVPETMHLAHLWDSSRKNDGRYSLEELRNDCRVMDTVLEDLPELRKYWQPFGALLVKMEREGMLIDRGYLSEIEKVAIAERQLAADKFRKWESKYCPDAKYIYTMDDIQEDNEDTSDSENPDGDSSYGTAYEAFRGGNNGKEACHAIAALWQITFYWFIDIQFHSSVAGRLSVRTPNLQNQPALEKDRYKIRQAFVAAPGNSLIVADYGQLELRMLAHLTNCKSMLDAFKAGGDFHSRTAMNMYQHIRDAVHDNKVLLEWHPQPGQEKPPVPLLKDAFGAERRKAKMLSFSIACGKTAVGLSKDWKSDPGQRGHIEHLIERAAINAPVQCGISGHQGSAADVVMCAMLEIERNARLKELGWRLLLQVHDEVILEGPSESAEVAKAIVVECMSKPFYGTNILKVDLTVDAKCSKSWYAAK
ncbi:hypothetical protein HU200_022869 [Digitaria exilis]|uniref:DNA-directed DNA polymerase family A palm domain-containing protein n=1 Tax=Digitaria exilis TaxID=1010633 RepID=A0A835CD99_9POAL|nr:hypothetical protein HU200_022869 [Digitaria exilis]